MTNSRVVVDRYMRKCWWADRDDLEQEAAIVELELRKRETLPAHYVRAAIAKRLHSVLWEMSSPVTAPKDGRREKLQGTTRAQLDDSFEVGGLSVEDSIFLKMALERVEGRMPHLFGVASQVLMGERPRDLERRTGLSRRFIYDAVARVRAALREDIGG